jgi:hypothetical protein
MRRVPLAGRLELKLTGCRASHDDRGVAPRPSKKL